MTLEPRLIAITDVERFGARPTLEAFGGICQQAVPGSVMIQLRDRQLEARQRWELGSALREITRERAQWFSVNDRLDLALALNADGVHLAEHSVAPSDARRLQPSWWLSAACHDPRSTPAPELDAWLLSPIAAERKGRPALGPARLRETRARLPASFKLYGLGGIDRENAGECLAQGADGVAVIGAAYRDAPALLEALGIRA